LDGLAVAPYWASWRVLALPGSASNNFGVGAGAGQDTRKGGMEGARGSIESC
jgi:hypothetical protein